MLVAIRAILLVYLLQPTDKFVENVFLVLGDYETLELSLNLQLIILKLRHILDIK